MSSLDETLWQYCSTSTLDAAKIGLLQRENITRCEMAIRSDSFHMRRKEIIYSLSVDYFRVF